MRGGLGGGVMALLGAMAYQALKNRGGQTARVPLGLAAPQTEAERAEQQESGADAQALEFLAAELKKPMETAVLVEAARGQPGLEPEVTQRIHQELGLA